MYLTKKKTGASVYKNFKPKLSKHQEIEASAYIASLIGTDLPKCMSSTIETMSDMIVRGFTKGGDR